MTSRLLSNLHSLHDGQINLEFCCMLGKNSAMNDESIMSCALLTFLFYMCHNAYRVHGDVDAVGCMLAHARRIAKQSAVVRRLLVQLGVRNACD